MELSSAYLGFDQKRVEVTIFPATSEYAELAREAAHQAGAEFVRSDGEGTQVGSRQVIVVDLSDTPPRGRLGSRVIAISGRQDLDCYEVVSPTEVRSRLKRAVRNAVEREQLVSQVRRGRQTLEMLNEIGYALSAQSTLPELLDTVLTYARRLLRADGGSIYLVEDDKVRFLCSQNDTVPFRASRTLLEIDEQSVPGHVAKHGEPLNIEDCAAIPDDAPYRPRFTFDRETGYQTRSLMAVPMKDRDGQMLGVLMLVNHKTIAGKPLASFDRVEPFGAWHVDIARSIASQAAVAIENYRLYREIQGLFDGFVEAAVTAIEARDPSTGGHSYRVAELTTRLAEAVDATTDGPFGDVRFGAQHLTELHYAAMLHDFGKVGVREQILLKAEKLYSWEMDRIEDRFRLASLQVMLESIRDQLKLGATSKRLDQLKHDLGIVRRLNRPSTRPTPYEVEELQRIAREWNMPDMGDPVINNRDVTRLCIPLGSLDPDERRQIQEHVTHTWQFLKHIPWTRSLKQVPELAYAHHEKLDGSGYPRGLAADEIPLGARLMTVADIFDALTAGDRPYKTGIPPEQALAILRGEAAAGKVMEDVVELLAARKLWDGVIGKMGRNA